nr:hypothetical protein [Angustibacter aerolatus]
MIRLHGVEKTYGDGTTAVRSLTLDVRRGEPARAGRPLGLRQVHDLAHGQPSDRAHPRQHRAWTART